MALGVIAPLCASLSPVLAGPEGCSRGRWRSGPSKWRHTAALGGRGQGAPRTCRCIETTSPGIHAMKLLKVREHHAPVGALRQNTDQVFSGLEKDVREHHAPVGALRHQEAPVTGHVDDSQGAPRTCRCIETQQRVGRKSVSFPCQGAPRTCRCIELFSPRVVARGRCGGCCLLRGSGGAGFSNGGVPRPHCRARWARIGFGGGSPGGEPFPGGTGSFGGASRSVVAPVTSWGSCSAAPGPAGEAAPNRLLRLFLSATPFHPPLRSFFPYSRG